MFSGKNLLPFAEGRFTKETVRVFFVLFDPYIGDGLPYTGMKRSAKAGRFVFAAIKKHGLATVLLLYDSIYFCSRSIRKVICSWMPRGMQSSSTSNCWLCRAAVMPFAVLPQPR